MNDNDPIPPSDTSFSSQRSPGAGKTLEAVPDACPNCGSGAIASHGQMEKDSTTECPACRTRFYITRPPRSGRSLQSEAARKQQQLPVALRPENCVITDEDVETLMRAAERLEGKEGTPGKYVREGRRLLSPPVDLHDAPAKPVLVPPTMSADVANSLYGDRYGTDWEYVG